jgi:hypothetical protein
MGCLFFLQQAYFSAGQARKFYRDLATLTTGSQKMKLWAFAAVSTSCSTLRGATNWLISALSSK